MPHLGACLRGIVGCDVVLFLSLPRAPIDGAGALAVEAVGCDAEITRECRAFYGSSAGTTIDPASRALTQRMGAEPFAAADRRDLVDDQDWYSSAYVDIYRRRWGWDHSIYSARRRDDGSVLVMCFGRDWDAPPFDADAAALATLFHRECTWMLEAEVDTIATIRARLAPRCRETLDAVLHGGATKEIADQLGLSIHTVRHYEKALHTAFSVQTRGQLLARCLAG